jgi:hypothetical protein
LLFIRKSLSGIPLGRTRVVTTTLGGETLSFGFAEAAVQQMLG